MKQFQGMNVKITLKVDQDSFFEYTMDPVLEITKDAKAKVILSEDHFSVTLQLQDSSLQSSAAKNYRKTFIIAGALNSG